MTARPLVRVPGPPLAPEVVAALAARGFAVEDATAGGPRTAPATAGAATAGAATAGAAAAGAPREPAVILLREAAFPSLDALFAARAASPLPALVVVGADAAAAALQRLGLRDDISLADAPPPLIAHRVAALARGLDGREPLTGLLSRRAFFALAAPRLAAASREHPVSAIAIDLDRFKQLNDTHGHQAGDAVLGEVAARLSAAAPPEALLGRIGGEELAVLAPGSEGTARALANRMLEVIRERPFLDGIRATASAGISTARAPTDAATLFSECDDAVYAAKAAGRDRAVHIDDDDLTVQGFESQTRILAERVADVIARKGRRLFKKLKDEAEVDPVTGLQSRRYLDRHLGVELDGARGRGEPFAIALIDIDDFGEVNKRHGWPSGDKVLADLAARVRAAVRDGDWVARYGGDEVLVVMRGADEAQAARVAERIRAALAALPFTATSGEPIPLTASLGVAASAAGEPVERLLERASARARFAKSTGKDRVEAGGAAPATAAIDPA